MAQPKKAPDPKAPKELGKPLTPAAQIGRIRFGGPGGNVLAAGCFDGKVRRWDLSGKDPVELPELGGHNGWVTDVAWGSGQLFSCDSWGRLSAWHLAGTEAKPHWSVEDAHDGWIRGICFDARATLVATCGKDGFVRLWERAKEQGKKVREFELKTDQLSVCFGPAGKSVFSGDLFGTVRELDPASGKETRAFELKELHKADRVQDVGGARCLLVSGDGKSLFVAGAEPKSGAFVQAVPLLVAIDVASGKRTGQWKGANDNEGYVTDLAWHPDGVVIFTTSGQPGQGKFHVWKPGDAMTLFSGGKHPNCHSVAVYADGSKVAVSATNANSSGNGRVKGAGGEYPANTSPIQLWGLPKFS
jgi:WD40 repeat protein